MNFECESNNPKKLANIFESVNPVLENGNLTIHSKGIYLSGIDPSHVAFLKLMIKKEYFQNFNLINENKDVDDEESNDNFSENKKNIIYIGLDFKIFIKILKSSEKNDSIILKYQEDKDYLSITIKNNSIKRNFHLKLLDLENNKINIPKINYNLNIEMRSIQYERIISSFDIVDSKYIEISSDKTKVILKSNSHLSESEVVLEKNDRDTKENKNYLIINNKYVKPTSYNLEKLKSFLKGNCLNDKVNISLNENFPIKISYEIEEKNNSSLTYYLAPKIDDDE